MEWVGRRVRKAAQNALGQEIHFSQLSYYFLHDTPSKAYLIENKGPLVMVVFG
jgi:hypothetical protein